MRRLVVLLVCLCLQAPATAAPLDAGAAKALLDRWLKAQNSQDFAAYQGLYAQKFDGIKRAGARTRNFDRKRWLLDRQRMFAKAMTVKADKVEVAVLPGMVRLRFVQSFSVGSFHDEGPKELVLVAEGGRPVISREEMLQSTLGKPALPKDGNALFVVPGGVRLPISADDSWGKGPPKLLKRAEEGSGYTATRPVDPAAVSPEARAFIGRMVYMVGQKKCTARISGLALMVRADPHFSTTQYWSGMADEEGGRTAGKPLSLAEIARDLWKLAPVELIGTLDRSCGDARWGTIAAKPALAKIEELTPTSSIGIDAMTFMRKHAAYRKVQKEYAESVGHKDADPWVNEVAIHALEAPGQSLVVLSVSRYEGCADFGAGLTYLFSRGPGDKLTLLNDPGEQAPWKLEDAADLDGDGVLELLGAGVGIPGGELMILRRQGARYDVSDTSSEAMLDCYC